MRKWYLEDIKDSGTKVKTFSTKITEEELQWLKMDKLSCKANNARELLLDSLLCLRNLRLMTIYTKAFGYDIKDYTDNSGVSVDEVEQIKDLFLNGLMDSNVVKILRENIDKAGINDGLGEVFEAGIEALKQKQLELNTN